MTGLAYRPEFGCKLFCGNTQSYFCNVKMTRGNQRDLARQKNQKKQQEVLKKKTANEKTGMTLEQRKFRDAELMREKQKRKEEEAAKAQNQKVH